MPEPDKPPVTAGDDDEATASADAGEHKPEGFAISPAIGPLPAVYIPQSPSEPSAAGLFWHAEAQAVRQARSWAACHLPHHDPECRANESPASVAPPTVPMANPPGGTVTDIPADLRYSKDHLWARPGAASLVRVGVTDFAQQSLGDVTDVTLPEPGSTVTAGEACGDIESVKSLSDLIAPVTGTVRARNDDLTDSPELINTAPYGQGWMFEVETDPATQAQQLDALMDADGYRALAGA